MNATARSIAGGLAAIVGREAVRDDEPGCAAMAVDGSIPRWVVRPGTVEQVSAVVALAHDARLVVRPRGSGSSLDLGRPPDRTDVVLDLAGLDRVLEWSPDDLTVSVEAGVTAGALASQLATRRQILPVDPPGVAGRTLGGLVATAASGPLRARYGTLRDLLLGVRFVQADGVVTWGGSKVVKSVSGYDVPKLMVGALGTLGVLGELTLRLHPAPEAEATWLVRAGDARMTQVIVDGVLGSAIQPNRLEVLNGAALEACGLVESPAALAVSLGTVEAAVREQGEVLVDLARRAGGIPTSAPPDFWSRYAGALEAGRGLVLRVSTLVSGLADTLDAIERVAAGGDGAAPLVAGSAAVGALCVSVPPIGVERAVAVVADLRALVERSDGSVVVVAGPREVRERLDPWGPVADGRMALMRAIKTEFDPSGVLNPGRFVGGM